MILSSPIGHFNRTPDPSRECARKGISQFTMSSYSQRHSSLYVPTDDMSMDSSKLMIRISPCFQSPLHMSCCTMVLLGEVLLISASLVVRYGNSRAYEPPHLLQCCLCHGRCLLLLQLSTLHKTDVCSTHV